MSVPRETLMAFVDGELSPAEESRVAAEIARDPALNAYVQQQKALRVTLRDEFASVLGAPLPAGLEEAVLRTPINRKSVGRVRLAALLPNPRHWTPWLAGGAMATGIALGLLLAPAFDEGPIGSKDDRLVARGELARVLSGQLASEQNFAAGPATRIGMTFRDRDGDLCRTFVSEAGENDFAGIACRDGEDWRIAMLSPASAQDRDTFQQAGAAMPPILRESVGSMITGMPFDAAQERAARDSGWR